MHLNKFEFESSNILVITVAGEPWFKAKDVADILGYKDTNTAIIDHVDEEDKASFAALKGGGETPPPCNGTSNAINEQPSDDLKNMQPNTVFINESGLYSLILGSKLPKAKEFKRWVTSEVLPALRKTGEYKTEQNTITMLVQQLMLKDQQHAEERKQHMDLLIRKEDKIDTMRPNAVLPAPSKAKENNLYIFNKNESDAAFRYYAVRVQSESKKKQLSAVREKYPHASIIYAKENDPNAVRLYNVAKTQLGLTFTGNEFSTQLSEDMLVRNLDMLYNEYL